MQRAFTEKKSRKKYAIKHAIDQVLRKTKQNKKIRYRPRRKQENMLSTKKRASFKKESKKSF